MRDKTKDIYAFLGVMVIGGLVVIGIVRLATYQQRQWENLRIAENVACNQLMGEYIKKGTENFCVKDNIAYPIIIDCDRIDKQFICKAYLIDGGKT